MPQSKSDTEPAKAYRATIDTLKGIVTDPRATPDNKLKALYGIFGEGNDKLMNQLPRDTERMEGGKLVTVPGKFQFIQNFTDKGVTDEIKNQAKVHPEIIDQAMSSMGLNVKKAVGEEIKSLQDYTLPRGAQVSWDNVTHTFNLDNGEYKNVLYSRDPRFKQD